MKAVQTCQSQNKKIVHFTTYPYLALCGAPAWDMDVPVEGKKVCKTCAKIKAKFDKAGVV